MPSLEIMQGKILIDLAWTCVISWLKVNVSKIYLYTNEMYMYCMNTFKNYFVFHFMNVFVFKNELTIGKLSEHVKVNREIITEITIVHKLLCFIREITNFIPTEK